MNSVLPFTSNSHRRRHFSSPSLFNAPNTPLLGLTLTNILFTAAASKGPGEKEGEIVWEARSMLGLPVVTMSHQGGAETPWTPLQLCSPGSCGLSGPGCPQPPCQAVRDALDKVWGWWPRRGAGGGWRARTFCPTQSCLCPLLFFPAPLSAQPHPSCRTETQLRCQGGGGAAAEMSISLGDGDGAIRALMASPGL